MDRSDSSDSIYIYIYMQRERERERDFIQKIRNQKCSEGRFKTHSIKLHCRKPRGLMDKVQGYNVDVSEFDLYSRGYVQFQTNNQSWRP